MLGLTSIAETAISALGGEGNFVVLTAVTTQGVANAPTTTGIAAPNELVGQAAAGAAGTITGQGPATTSISGLASSTSIAALIFDAAANTTSPAATASTAINSTTQTGEAGPTLATVNALGSAFGDVESLTTHNYTITVANSGSGNKFYIDGVEAAELTLVRGATYVFDVSDNTNSGHPFRFKDALGGSYTTGVTASGTAGQTGATVTLELPLTGTMPARYYCTVHGNGMGNIVRTVQSTTNFTVTVSNVGGVNVFVLNGINTPTLQLSRGVTYVFDVSDNSVSGHPLAFKNGSSSYTSGVTVSGSAGNTGSTVTFAVPTDAPSQGLRYYCTSHGNAMGNTITTSSTSSSLFVTGPANFTIAAATSTFSQTAPTVTGPGNIPIGSVFAPAVKNSVSATGVVFPFEDFADQFNRGRTVVIRPVNKHRVVYITS
tara:strand:+ start:410 stop:1705 length:1296 start_codon:yes stop_codon:yes gene_type:complete